MPASCGLDRLRKPNEPIVQVIGDPRMQQRNRLPLPKASRQQALQTLKDQAPKMSHRLPLQWIQSTLLRMLLKLG